MDKEILEQYIDTCELLRDTKREVLRLKQQKRVMASDSVKGSMDEFPFVTTNFHIQGLAVSGKSQAARLEQEEKLLEKQERELMLLKQKVEEWMRTVPVRMRRIIHYRVLDGDSWEQVAARMGRKSTAESIRKEYQRFIKTQNH